MPQVQVDRKDLWGSSPPSLFVGRHGYPHVNVGPMLPPQHLEPDAARRLDDPAAWMDHLTIPDVVGLRSSLIRTTHKARVHDAMRPDRITAIAQELSVAARPVDTEVHLRKVPRFDITHVGDFTAPHGPTAEVERATLGENVPVARRVEHITGDTDLRAGEGVVDLYRNGTDIYHLERILSAGMLGQARGRRLVPTRWAITATDDMVGRALAEGLRDLPTIDKPVVHEGERFGNRFLVLLLPRVWGFQNIEVWLKGSFWASAGGTGTSLTPASEVGPADATTASGVAPVPTDGAIPAQDWEDHRGRTAYATETTGGYYATRLSVLEHLMGLGRQATAVVVREIGDAYTTPLGVWVVREACKRALASDGLLFEDTAAALRHMDRRGRFPAWRRHAPLLDQVLAQRSLDQFG